MRKETKKIPRTVTFFVDCHLIALKKFLCLLLPTSGPHNVDTSIHPTISFELFITRNLKSRQQKISICQQHTEEVPDHQSARAQEYLGVALPSEPRMKLFTAHRDGSPKSVAGHESKVKIEVEGTSQEIVWARWAFYYSWLFSS